MQADDPMKNASGVGDQIGKGSLIDMNGLKVTYVCGGKFQIS